MVKDRITIDGVEMDVYSLNTVIVGSGAAGFNAADSLHSLGVTDIAVVTEGINMGTSRNTGSDKQTYYKLTMSGGGPDSVESMAKTLFDGGSMHGDIALVEAALSAGCFYKLVQIGVPFPHNKYGEFVGYKTDHDPRARATSAGPLTSKYMTEKLERSVLQKGIKIFDGFLVIGILTAGDGKVIGLTAIDRSALAERNMGFTLFNCTNVVYAVGGPAGMYMDTVYPASQNGASGIAFEAGAEGVNLTESQYGISSLKFRWNLSGTYQQVLPRYISTDAGGGDEKEFLLEHFKDAGALLDAVFLKGYQWPFDPRKIKNGGSSLIDLLVYRETQIKGRRVFLDYTHNPFSGGGTVELDFSLLGGEAYGYLEKSGALFGRPIDRLLHMNAPAVEIFREHGIDISTEYVEIAVCAQHNNGGLSGNIWYESNLRHFFPVGEVNGTFGVYRPGGSALNSTQVGSLRAAQYIAANYAGEPPEAGEFVSACREEISARLALAAGFVSGGAQDAGGGMRGVTRPRSLKELRDCARARMSRYGAVIRSAEGVEEALRLCLEDLESLENLRLPVAAGSVNELPAFFKTRDMLIAQYVYLSAIKEYIKEGGGSRGSYLVCSSAQELFGEQGGVREISGFAEEREELRRRVCKIRLEKTGRRRFENGSRPKPDYGCTCVWEAVRPLPEREDWFENVWRAYREGEIIK